MAREIKFRLWSLDEQKFVSDFRDQFIPCWSRESADEDCKVIVFHEERCNAVVQQFTGLKDKNGKDIFQGDIVKKTSREPKTDCQYCMGDYWMDDGSDPFNTVERLGEIIRGDQGGFTVKYINVFEQFPPNKGQRFWGFINKEESEVIGNIFENPELLKP